jgi:hypothetical protein
VAASVAAAYEKVIEDFHADQNVNHNANQKGQSIADR